MKNTMLSRCALVAAAVAAGHAGASGYQLMEQNASGLGNAYAGAAAAADDASTVFFNPAGMTAIGSRQFVAVGHLIRPSAKFSNTGSTAAAGGFGLGSNGGDAGDLVFVPNAYLVWPLTPQWTAGLGVSAPFGLATDYDTDWVGRFHALRSELRTVNVNPSLAYRVNDALSLGFGVNWQRADAELTKAVNYSFVAAAAGVPGVAPGSAGTNRIAGHDTGWGYNLGVMLNVTPQTRLGISYRSAIRYTISGDVRFANRPAALQAALASPALAAQLGDGAVTAALKVPAIFSVAVKHALTPRWEVLADATRTEWSAFQSLVVVRSGGTVLENTPENWSDTWRFGVGFNFRPDDRWTWRFGVAYDQSPVPEAFRTPRIPDQDRRWVAVGAQYKVSRAGAFDIGYAHIFVKDPRLSATGAPALTGPQVLGRGALVGDFENKVDILSIQYRHSF